MCCDCDSSPAPVDRSPVPPDIHAHDVWDAEHNCWIHEPPLTMDKIIDPDYLYVPLQKRWVSIANMKAQSISDPGYMMVAWDRHGNELHDNCKPWLTVTKWKKYVEHIHSMPKKEGYVYDWHERKYIPEPPKKYAADGKTEVLDKTYAYLRGQKKWIERDKIPNEASSEAFSPDALVNNAIQSWTKIYDEIDTEPVVDRAQPEKTSAEVITQQPALQPPPNAYYPGYPAYPNYPTYPGYPGYPGSVMMMPMPVAMPGPQVPGAFPSYGQTPYQVTAQQAAYASKHMNGKNEMVPSDPDPFRMYWVRELDQSWTQRDRRTIDSGDIGDVIWYVKDGKFYAVRQSSG